jgi:SM-20-related protein
MNEKIGTLVETLYSKGYSIAEGFLDLSAAEALLNALDEKKEQLKIAGIGKKNEHTTAKEIRSDKIAWIEKNENDVLDQLFFFTMDSLLLALNRRCFLGLNDYEFHFARYEPGTFYRRHKDVFKNDDARKISVILYLNTKWKKGDGGELKIYSEENEITVEPKGGTIVLFESHIEHEVLVSHTNRYSITGWLKNSRNPF